MSNEVSVATLRQYGGNGVANAAQRKRKLAVTSEGRRPGWVSYTYLTIALLLVIFPLYYAFSIASQPTPDTQYGPQALKFGSGLFTNLSNAFEELGYWHALGGTFMVSAVCSVTTVLFATLAGYSFSKLSFRGRKGLLLFVVATMAIPTQLAVVPLFVLMNKLHLFGSLWAVVIPGIVTAFGVFWMTQYLEGALPYELIEAARMDGASMIRTFWNVAIPAARPAMAMLFLFTFVAQWTNYFWPTIILGPNKGNMLTTAAAALKGAHFTDYTLIMSGVILTAAPLIILFFFMGRQLVSGIMAGAVKG
ncbi:MAG: carbohydrate ABC transporter permease [Promicromonosporaceae bacterium]|nr:carbohydrate ABC transporter permease [Promicromonosporaceae bacterium]